MKRTLIFCMSFLRNPYDGALLRIWQELIEWQNKGSYDLLIVDSPAKHSPTEFLNWPEEWRIQDIPDDDAQMMISGPRDILRFKNALGHPFHDGITHASGSDRAMMMGFQTAANSGYDRVVYIENDLLFFKPVDWCFEQMTKPAACLPPVSHGKFPETGAWFADVRHMQAIDFVKRYNWKGPCAPEGERRQWDIYGDDLEFLPLKGRRDMFGTPADMIERKFPDGLDWLTHFQPPTGAAALRMNGYPELAEMLA